MESVEGDIQREQERREILLKTVKLMVAKAEVKIFPEDPWRIKIEISSPRKTAIILEPSRPLMTDRDNGFQTIFEAGITEANRILSNPSVKTILQGRLYLGYKILFEEFHGR